MRGGCLKTQLMGTATRKCFIFPQQLSGLCTHTHTRAYPHMLIKDEVYLLCVTANLLSSWGSEDALAQLKKTHQFACNMQNPCTILSDKLYFKNKIWIFLAAFHYLQHLIDSLLHFTKVCRDSECFPSPAWRKLLKLWVFLHHNPFVCSTNVAAWNKLPGQCWLEFFLLTSSLFSERLGGLALLRYITHYMKIKYGFM